jgi:hypothetical protein
MATLLVLGGTVFGVLGALHAIYTPLDPRNPRRLVPADPSVAQAMANSALRLSGGRTDMWRAWISFIIILATVLVCCSSQAGVLGWVSMQHAPNRGHCASVDVDRLRLIGSRPALLVSCSCHRHRHWHKLLRRGMDSVAKAMNSSPFFRIVGGLALPLSRSLVWILRGDSGQPDG